jgi:hypothetical protein
MCLHPEDTATTRHEHLPHRYTPGRPRPSRPLRTERDIRARRQSSQRPPPDLTLPLATPPLEVTLRRLDERAKALLELPALNAALVGQRPPGGAGEELAAVVAELYDLIGRTRHATDMIERSARDLPELASLFYHQWRRPLLRRIRAYLQSRMDSGQFRRLDDLGVAAVFVLETVAWSASHRFHDPDGRRLDDASTRSTIIDLMVGTFMPRGITTSQEDGNDP